MSQEPPAKSVRKGTKSCIECRHRKVRCVWLSEGAETCQSCLTRGRKCEMQVRMMPTSNAVRVTSRARIRHLESEVSSLWATVHNLEAKLGCVHTEAATHPQPLSQTENADVLHDKPSDDDSDSNTSDLSPTNPPSHLLQLFDNGLLGSYGSATPSHHASSLDKAQRSSILRRLMPSREDMLIIATHASSWLSLYNALFPMINITKTSDEMLSQYDKLQDPNTDLVAIAALLLSIAITVQQAPDDTAGRAVESIRDASSFIKGVSDSVERIIISDDALVGSLEGIETILLFLRLQLGRARVRKMWLLTRRVIALAELIGLPRVSMAMAPHQESLAGTSRGAQAEASPSLAGLCRQKAEVWEYICAVDRIISMMWSLPLGTVNYPLPKRPIVDSQGQVNPQSYLYNLADIASRILELDNIYSSGRPLMELFNAVIGTDQELRSLASLTPKSWWKIHSPELSIDALLQYWHQYLTVRTHLQLALKYDEGQEFAFNFITCLDACQELARRYVSMRPILPAGFFANQVIDLQAFTAIVFLLLASFRTTRSSGTFLQAVDVNVTTGLVDQVVRMMGFAADWAGGDFAHQAVDAIRSLSSLLQQPQTLESQEITLNLALVGRIHVSRKIYAAKAAPKQPYPTSSQQPQGLWQTTTSSDGSASATQAMPFRSSDLDLMDSLSYSMEIPENYPFLTDETFGTEQWLTWTGRDGNG
ncbi:MAG: hypothetical protein M1834_007237 [Cirrosporium novae-zelandiae]|nr:MAG: hypothetical protein M1834_007237 [Cirrosporium novae-zelandiae]